jgi:hypothetical protein
MADNKKADAANTAQLFPYFNVNGISLVFPPRTNPIAIPAVQDLFALNTAIQDINELAKKGKISTEDIERIKEKAGLNTYTVSQRFTLFKQANLWGQAAYEINGMSFGYIVVELSSLTIAEIQNIYTSGKAYPGVGENSQAMQIAKCILEWQSGQNARDIGIDWAVSNISLRHRTMIEWNRMKFNKNKSIVLPVPTHQENLFFGKKPSYSGFPPPSRETPQFPQGKEKLASIVWKELEKEGSSASINIWDNAIFTWGRGFAGKGGALMTILVKLYRDSQIGELFRNVGIHITANEKLVILDPITNTTIIGGINDIPVWNYIKNNHALLLFFISLSEMRYMPFVKDDSTKQEIRKKVIDEQFNFIVNNNPVFTIPENQLAKWRADLGNDYENFVVFVAHLYHWLPTFVNTQKTENNVLIGSNGGYIRGSIKELLFQFAKKAGKGRAMPWISMSEVNRDPATLFTVFNDLSKAKFGVEKLVLDNGHFKVWGNGIAYERVFKMAARFNNIDEVTNPKSPLWLLSPQFNDAAVYFNPDLKSGYIINR